MRFLVLCASVVAAAACTFPYAGAWGPNNCVFANHMVIASNAAWSGGVTPAFVYGVGVPGEKITLTGLPAGATVAPSNPWPVQADGTWSITLSAATSLTPFNLTFVGAKNSVTISDVLSGHTVLCSGQSNMDMPVGCSYTADETYAISLQYPEIRLMNQGATGQWYSAANAASNSSVELFSATCYFTALNLKLFVPAFKDVPIGLVRSSVGGQAIERFMSIPALEAVGVPAINATNVSCGQSAHTLYDSLIFPLAPFVFKAMIWCELGCAFGRIPSRGGVHACARQLARVLAWAGWGARWRLYLLCAVSGGA